MKQIYTLALSLLALLMISTQASANTVIVKGTITYSNGNPVANWALFISDSSSAASCKQTHTVYTNANGYYSDTFSCTGSDIRKLSIYTHDCTGAYLIHNLEIPVGSNVVESNFVTCGPTVTGCEAAFTFTREANSQVVHYTSATAHGASSYDKIVKRRWKFADGDTLEGNVVDPAHTYANKGTYQTCLTIWTSAGCENTVCKTVIIADSTPRPVPPVHCVSKFTWEVLGTSNASTSLRTVRFNSSTSSVAPQDSIHETIWKFGDGTQESSINPLHVYSKSGIYNVCLIIRSAGGCSDTTCTNIQIPEPTPVVHCSAKFVSEIVPATNVTGVYVKFNSSTSSTSTGDSIRERIWKFGDGTTGSTIDPAHYYAKGGVYTVCLIIRSVKGCSDSICNTIQLPIVTPPTCHADFAFTQDGANVKFNSSISSGDSIISRQWIFGDSSATGTTVDPTHKYAKSGVYTVCLYIKTARGCESKECKQVTVTIPVTTPPIVKCTAIFTAAHVAPKKFSFNSSASAVAANDSIIERSWSFGDGSAALGGNVVNPSKEYVRSGIYSVCLKIRTAKGCDNSYCTTVKLEDTTSTPVNTTEFIKIVSLHPNPVVTPLGTEVWSKFNNVTAELSIYDIYGVKKWGVTKVLLQGTNVTSIPTGFLLPGPYFFRVTTMYGVKSAPFYKL